MVWSVLPPMKVSVSAHTEDVDCFERRDGEGLVLALGDQAQQMTINGSAGSWADLILWMMDASDELQDQFIEHVRSTTIGEKLLAKLTEGACGEEWWG